MKPEDNHPLGSKTLPSLGRKRNVCTYEPILQRGATPSPCQLPECPIHLPYRHLLQDSALHPLAEALTISTEPPPGWRLLPDSRAYHVEPQAPVDPSALLRKSEFPKSGKHTGLPGFQDCFSHCAHLTIHHRLEGLNSRHWSITAWRLEVSDQVQADLCLVRTASWLAGSPS